MEILNILECKIKIDYFNKKITLLNSNIKQITIITIITIITL